MIRAATTSILVLVLAGTLQQNGSCDDNPPAPETQWSNAKQRHVETLTKLRQSVVEHLNARDLSARDQGDLAKVKQVKTEQEAFDKLGQFPTGFDKSSYNRALKNAQEELKTAQKSLLTFFLKAKRDPEAEELEKELHELLARTSENPIKPSPDPRLRWSNSSYKTTIHHMKDKTWAETEINADNPKWHLQETSRTADHIELYLPERQQTWRLLTDRMEFRRDGQWQWLASGHWVDPSGKAISWQQSAP
jgi:hypothetical protein